MLKLLRQAATVAAIFAVGTILGPLFIAVVASLHQADQGFHSESEATQLVEAYRANLAPMRLFTSVIPPDDGEACGYDPNELFPDGIMELAEARSNTQFTDYEGYYALERWASKQRDESYIARITDRIDQTMSRREIEFLRRCIQSTLFADICMQKVEAYGEKVARFPDDEKSPYFPAGGHEQDVICTYLDAVAARRGISIVKR